MVQVINKGGITYKATPWHRECFTCTGCNKVLVGEKFTSRDEKPFCADCFAMQFAKKCIRCTQPITGQSTTRYFYGRPAWWRGGATGKAFGLAISRSRVQILLEATLRKNLRQVVYTYVPLSPSSITWYRPKGGDALRLGR